MNSYKLSRSFVDFSFENPSKIKPNHYALYFFSIEHCNRLGWKKEFGLPTTMTMEAIGIKSYNTYIKTFNELIEYGFFKLIERSKNQYSSNIIELSYFNKALDKALDKAFIKHATKREESTQQSIDSINKPLNKKQETINYTKDDFLKNWNEARTYYDGTPSNLNTLKPNELDLFDYANSTFKKEDFHLAIKGLFNQEVIPKDIMTFRPKHLLDNIETYIDAELNKKYTLYK